MIRTRCSRENLAWPAALAVMVCLYNLPQLLTGTVQFDGLDVHYSAQRYLSDELHAGRLPFWTPYIFTGFPFLADLQVGAWYPLNWPFFLSGITPGSIGGELLLHDLIACGGAYALAMRHLRAPLAATAAAVFYGLGGWFAAHSQHVGMFDTAAWLPWLLLVLESLAVRVTIKRLALAALAGAAVILPGAFQVALYTFSFVGVWAVLEACARRSWRHALAFAAGLAVAGIGGSLLSAVVLLPAAELVGKSVRTQLDALNLPNIGYFHPDSLLTLVNPNHYGLLSDQYTGPGDHTQHYFYAGVFLVPLVVFGAVAFPRIGRMAAFLGLPFVWYAVGPPGGLYEVLARLPGFRSVELPMHGWFLVAFGLALLGGAGVAVIEQRLGHRASVAMIAVLFVDVVTVNQLLDPLAYARATFDELYGSTLGAFGAQLGGVARLYGPPLTAIGYRNHALQSRVETTYGYNPLELESYAEYADAAEANPRLIAGFAADHRLLPGAHVQTESDALPLAYFVRRIEAVPDTESVRAALASLDPATATLVMGGPPTPVEVDPSASVEVVARGLEALTLRYQSATPNLLRVAIPAYSGWRATLNGAELPIVTVDGAFTGIVLPPGNGEVELGYTPRWFGPGAAISAAALIVTLVALITQRPAQLGKALNDRVDT